MELIFIINFEMGFSHVEFLGELRSHYRPPQVSRKKRAGVDVYSRKYIVQRANTRDDNHYISFYLSAGRTNDKFDVRGALSAVCENANNRTRENPKRR